MLFMLTNVVGDGATDVPLIEQPVRETSYNLPKGFAWHNIDLSIPAHVRTRDSS
jgi:hypothetical protein